MTASDPTTMEGDPLKIAYAEPEERRFRHLSNVSASSSGCWSTASTLVDSDSAVKPRQPEDSQGLLPNVWLPPELMERVFAFVAVTVAAEADVPKAGDAELQLLDLALVCRYWYACAMPLLWKSPRVFREPAAAAATTTAGSPAMEPRSRYYRRHLHRRQRPDSTDVLPVYGAHPNTAATHRNWIRSAMDFLTGICHQERQRGPLPASPLDTWRSFLLSARGKNGHSVDAEGTSKQTTAAILGISLAHCIQELDLSQSTACGVTVTDADVFHLAKHAIHLRRLNLTSCNAITDTSLEFLAQSPCIETLEAVNFSNCMNITDSALAPFFRRATRLQAVNLKSCIRITDTSVVALGSSCPSVRRLRINGCINVTDGALTELSQHCHQLSWLDVGGCPFISDNGIIALVWQNPNLQWLDISRPQRYKHRELQVTDDAILAIVDACQRLELLDLSNCNAITDRSLIYLAQHATTLKSLSLKSLHQITADSIMALGDLRRKYKRLIWLQIYNCRSISGEVIDEMIRRLNDGWRKGPYDTNVHREVMNGKSWEDTV